LFGIILCGAQAINAQDRAVVVLQGQILNDSLGTSDITIVNLNKEMGVITTSTGAFEIDVSKGDTLLINAVQYESKQFKITNTIFQRAQLALYLLPKVTALEEVVIYDLSLSGSLLRDGAGFDSKKVYDAKRANLPANTASKRTKEERRLYTATTRGPDMVGRYNMRLDIPLLAVINGITGKTKRLKKHIAVSNFQTEVDKIRTLFSDSIYIQQWQLRPEWIDDFVFYAWSDDEARENVKKGTLLDLFMYFQHQSKSFITLKQKELSKHTPKK
jgi:hypothetical protein